MVPLKMLGVLFRSDEEYVPPEYRAQRRINLARIPTIKHYILDNRETYVFSALAASINGEIRFSPSGANLGMLEISMDAKFLINDGQHRKAAILEAIQEDETLSSETIPIVFFEDQGLVRSQQMFTDLNKHAVKTSNSIAELYDSRDTLAVATRRVISQIEFLNKYTDKERDNLGKYSSSLFTLNSFYTANKRILKQSDADEDGEAFLLHFWSGVTRHIIQWNEMHRREITKIELRETYIVAQAVVVQALGQVGNALYRYKECIDDLNVHLQRLEDIDWSRSAIHWQLRVIASNGRMINSETAIMLTTNVIKQHLKLPLTQKEIQKETNFSQGKGYR